MSERLSFSLPDVSIPLLPAGDPVVHEKPAILLPSAIQVLENYPRKQYLERATSILERLKNLPKITIEDLDSAIAEYPWEESSDEIGRYKIMDRINFGGMGTIYPAVELETGDMCCIKRLNKDFKVDAFDVKQLFLRESMLLLALDHPNIVKGRNVFIHNDEIYLVMDFRREKTLLDKLVDKGSMNPHETFRVIEDLSNALEYLHERGIIFRDFKPNNILSGEKESVLIDLGLSSAVIPHDPDKVMGSPGYVGMFDFEDNETKDVLAFGAVTHLMLLGEPLFVRDTINDSLTTVYRRSTFDERMIKLAGSLYSKGYVNAREYPIIIRKSTMIEQEARYQTINDYMHAYREALIKSQISGGIFATGETEVITIFEKPTTAIVSMAPHTDTVILSTE